MHGAPYVAMCVWGGVDRCSSRVDTLDSHKLPVNSRGRAVLFHSIDSSVVST